MIARKPAKGDRLEYRRGWSLSGEFQPLGTVDYCDGNICWYVRSDGKGADSFIWFFERDQQHNRLIRIAE
jgi:hypothetical protein